MPVSIPADTTYVVSYLAPNGHYSVNAERLLLGDQQPAAAARWPTPRPNGVYRYGATSAFPTSSFNASNYWVDVLFDPGS